MISKSRKSGRWHCAFLPLPSDDCSNALELAQCALGAPRQGPKITLHTDRIQGCTQGGKKGGEECRPLPDHAFVQVDRQEIPKIKKEEAADKSCSQEAEETKPVKPSLHLAHSLLRRFVVVDLSRKLTLVD